MYTEFNIKRVYLMLGGKCNYSCRHCIQCESGFLADEYDGKALEYIQHLSNIRPKQIGKITVIFWGGEPLLYFDTIKMVVEKIGDAVKYAMVSNGSMLTEEVVDFCNKHHIQYVLSNDGPHTDKIRGENLLENDCFVNLFNRIEGRAIDSVISAYNQDYYSLWEYIEKKVGDVPVYTEFLECTWDMPEDIYNFDLILYRDMMKRIVKQAHDDVLSGKITKEVRLLQSYAGDIMRTVKKVENGEKVILSYPRCKQVRESMNIDLRGNVYACHNFSEKIGTIDDEYETLLKNYDSRYKLSPMCERCRFLIFCRGGCPFAKDSIGKESCCKIKDIFISSCLQYIISFANVLEEVELEG